MVCDSTLVQTTALRRVPPLYPLTRAHEVDSATRWMIARGAPRGAAGRTGSHGLGGARRSTGRSLYWRSISSSLATFPLITLSEDEVLLPRQELKCLHEQITSRGRGGSGGSVEAREHLIHIKAT